MRIAPLNLLLGWCYRRWRSPPAARQGGYSLLMTVPPDLPVFLKIAIAVCRRQDLTHLVETLIIPDHVHRRFGAIFDEARRQWPQGKLRLVEPRGKDRLVRGLLRSPSKIHWLQLALGVEACRSSHAILHDVDLFLLDPSFLRTHYEHCARHNLACVGLNRPWEGLGWTRLPQFQHVVSLWEVVFDIDWARGMTPAGLRPQQGRIAGQSWWFETMLYALARTPEELVQRRAEGFDHIHFQWVISTYRRFQGMRKPRHDVRFSLLLIRLLVDAFTPEHPVADLPDYQAMARGLGDPTQPVHFLAEAKTADFYREFRERMAGLLSAGILEAGPVSQMQERLAPFDRFYQGVPSAPAAPKAAAAAAE